MGLGCGENVSGNFRLVALGTHDKGHRQISGHKIAVMTAVFVQPLSFKPHTEKNLFTGLMPFLIYIYIFPAEYSLSNKEVVTFSACCAPEVSNLHLWLKASYPSLPLEMLINQQLAAASIYNLSGAVCCGSRPGKPHKLSKYLYMTFKVLVTIQRKYYSVINHLFDNKI